MQASWLEYSQPQSFVYYMKKRLFETPRISQCLFRCWHTFYNINKSRARTEIETWFHPAFQSRHKVNKEFHVMWSGCMMMMMMMTVYRQIRCVPLARLYWTLNFHVHPKKTVYEENHKNTNQSQFDPHSMPR